LNDFIRNKKCPEVVKAARQEQYNREYKNATAVQANNPAMNRSEKEMFFVRDAEKAVSLLENLKINELDNEETQLYITTVHGMKSALANVDEKEFSDIASRLEQAGKDQDLAVMSNETPAFVSALQSLIEKFKPAGKNGITSIPGENSISEENQAFLREKLHDIKIACAAYDKKAVKAVLKEISQKTWSKHIDTVLEDISVHILHTEFDEAAIVAKNAVENLLYHP
jgi:HPt (histidine-containing phosphotransfer) domain-containing protein